VKHHWRFRIAAVLVSVVVTLGLLEGVWRIYLFHIAPPKRFLKWARPRDLPNKWIRIVPHPYLCYAGNPDYRSPDGKTRHNSLGFRGPEIAPKAPGEYRIAFVGGSTTYTYNVPEDEFSYPALVGKRLRGHFGHKNVQVINAGCIGYSSLQSLLNLELKVLDLEPDLVVVLHAINDIAPRIVPHESYRRDESGYRGVWGIEEPWWEISLFARYLAYQWGAIERMEHVPAFQFSLDPKYVAKALAANPPVHAARNLNEIVKLAARRGPKVMFATMATCMAIGDFCSWPCYQRAFKQHNAMTLGIGRKLSVPVFDWAAVMPTDKRHFFDGHHMKKSGARIKAEQFAGFIQERFLEGKGG